MRLRPRRWQISSAGLIFTFEDFLEQLEQVRNMGPLDQLLDMLGGAGNERAAGTAGG